MFRRTIAVLRRSGGGWFDAKRSMQQRVKRTERQEAATGERGQPALALGLREEGMQCARRRETSAETAFEGDVDGATRLGPLALAVRVAKQRIERGLGALKRERHAVAGERRD